MFLLYNNDLFLILIFFQKNIYKNLHLVNIQQLVINYIIKYEVLIIN